MSTGGPYPERGSPTFAAPVLAHVCSESRRVVMRTGRMYQMRCPDTDRAQWTWFDTEHDTFFINGEHDLQTWMKRYDPDFVLAVQHVFVGIEPGVSTNSGRRSRAARALVRRGLYRNPLDNTVVRLFPNLKTMFFYLLDQEIVLNAPHLYPRRRSLQNEDDSSQDDESQVVEFQGASDIAAMSHFDGPFELDPSKAHEVRWIEKAIVRRGGGVDVYHQRMASYIDYMVEWRKTIHRRVRGNWIQAEWDRSPVAMGRDELVLVASPVSAGGGDADDEAELAVTVGGLPGYCRVNAEHPWVKACLARMPEIRFVYTL
ncbi:hypothetical protein SLS62_005404 [Diatrype stigma]|uniref:Uncharacterized protein n=1 Tax=Diatrype stigma TaxID=117547 RepID=A0AAN9UUY7_9PEZI